MKKRLSSISAAALAFLAVADNAHAVTLIVYVNPTTWAIDCTSFGGDANWPNFCDKQASHQDQYGNWHYRYYTGGSFDTVVIERSDNHATLQTLSPCNNLFYIDRSVPSAYVCSTGYNGTGNGTSGEVVTAAAANYGDLWIGGRFGTAGGWQYSQYFSCFRWTEGWSGVNGVFAGNTVTQPLSWNATYQLLIYVDGANPYVYGPLSQGGTQGYVYAYPVNGNEWHNSFPNFWFQ